MIAFVVLIFDVFISASHLSKKLSPPGPGAGAGRAAGGSNLYKFIRWVIHTLAIVRAVCVDNQFTQRHRDVANRGCTMHGTLRHGLTGILGLVI